MERTTNIQLDIIRDLFSIFFRYFLSPLFRLLLIMPPLLLFASSREESRPSYRIDYRETAIQMNKSGSRNTFGTLLRNLGPRWSFGGPKIRDRNATMRHSYRLAWCFSFRDFHRKAHKRLPFFKSDSSTSLSVFGDHDLQDIFRETIIQIHLIRNHCKIFTSRETTRIQWEKFWTSWKISACVVRSVSAQDIKEMTNPRYYVKRIHRENPGLLHVHIA